MSVASHNLAVVSPELVLVAPADVAAEARLELPSYPPYPPVEVIAVSAGPAPDFGFLAFFVVCVLGTLGPVALAIALTR